MRPTSLRLSDNRLPLFKGVKSEKQSHSCGQNRSHISGHPFQLGNEVCEDRDLERGEKTYLYHLVPVTYAGTNGDTGAVCRIPVF